MPIIEGLKLRFEEEFRLIDARRFDCLVGMLIYFINTKPEILFATRVLSKLMHNPRILHFDAGNQILRYIKGKLDLGTFYRQNESPTFIQNTNHDLENCRID